MIHRIMNLKIETSYWTGDCFAFFVNHRFTWAF